MESAVASMSTSMMLPDSQRKIFGLVGAISHTQAGFGQRLCPGVGHHGHERARTAAGQREDPRAISGPLTRVTRGQPRRPEANQPGWSAPLAAVTAALPKLIVRVRFSSPALIVRAQARDGVPSLGLDRSGVVVDLPCN